MPKRKRDSEIDYISKKLRKLERKLRRAKRQRPSSPICRRREVSLPPEHNNEAEEEPTEHSVHSRSPTPDAVPMYASPPPLPLHAPAPAPLLAPSLAAPPEPAPAPMPAPVPAPLPALAPAPQPGPSSAQSAEFSSTAANSSEVTVTIDDDVIEILGSDPSQTIEYGKDIHVGLANRLEHIIVNGLENDTRKELSKKYLIPANCVRIIPPILNPEIKVALPDASVKRDKGIENRQKQLGTVIACLSDIITTQMNEKDKNPALLKQLVDAIKLVCDTLHSDSVKRRYFASSSLKKDVNDHLLQTKIDKYLFGESLNETLKTAKAVTKSGADLKQVYDKNKKLTQPQPSTSRGLNLKAPPPTRRQSGQQRSRQPYPPAGPRAPLPPPSRAPPPHAASSRTSRYQPRQPRRQ